jgi:hypothetical protein
VLGLLLLNQGQDLITFKASVYDLDKNPIEGRGIFQADSVETEPKVQEAFYPYLAYRDGGTV